MAWINGQWIDDTLPDTPQPWCPDCDPEGIHLTKHWEVWYCTPHAEARTPHGQLDHVVDRSVYITGSGESGGDDNRRICDLLHRPTKDTPDA